MNDTVDIIDKGFSCLVETLGVVNAERFIAMIKRDSFDYNVNNLVCAWNKCHRNV